MLHRLGKVAAGVLAAALIVTSCAANAPRGPKPLTADVEREAPPSDAPVDELVAGLSQFATDFSRLAEEGDENLVFSPASIGVAFAMALAGADEATAAAIAQAFGFPDGPGLHDAMNSLILRLGEANTDDVVAELANSTWVQHDFDIEAAFLETMAAYYGSGVQAVDFGDAEGSRQAINDWVAERTRDRIPELLPEDFITDLTRAVLVNAVYLYAAWASPFVEDLTSDEPFHLPDGSVVGVPTMRHGLLGAGLAGGEVGGNGYVAVDLPYEEGSFAMTVILPDEDVPLSELEANLSGADLSAVIAALQPATVDLSLPRWDIATDVDLAEPLSSLGVPLPGGDLSGVGEDLELEAAVHAANITVDEEGTEAAAATAVGVGLTSAPVVDETVVVDRPFLFVIRHVDTGLPLFYGRVTDPRG